MAKRSAKIIPMPIRQRLVCSECGADGEGSCRCGAPYVPPGERAAEAVIANPEKSDRAIAADLGVGNATVSRARRKATVSHDTVEKRTGRDGKARKMPVKDKPKQIEPELPEARLVPTEVYDDAAASNPESWRYSLMIHAGDTISMPAAWTRTFGKKWNRFPITSDLITLAEQAAAVWQQLATDLKGREQ